MCPARRGARRGVSAGADDGRLLEHWHTGSMTRRAQPRPDRARGGRVHVAEGHARARRARRFIRVATRRGAVEVKARADRDVAEAWCSSRSASPRPPPTCYQPAARPVGQDPRVQVLRGARRKGRTAIGGGVGGPTCSPDGAKPNPGPVLGFIQMALAHPGDAPIASRRAGIVRTVPSTQQDRADHGEIAELPLQLRHVLEVHAVDAGNRGWNRDDGEPSGR